MLKFCEKSTKSRIFTSYGEITVYSFAEEGEKTMWNNMSRVLKEALSPYDNTRSYEIWDRSMIAKVIDAYEKMQNISSGELNVYVNNLAKTLQIYVARYRPELAEQMNGAEVAVKFGQLRMLFEDRGTLDIDYSRRDFMMYRMYRVQNKRFQKYLNAFNSNVEDVDIEYNENDDDDKIAETIENIEFDETNADTLPKTPLSPELDIYETAKLVELRSRYYEHSELRELSNLMLDYVARRGIDDSKELRRVYSLNRRMKSISALLRGEESADALPMEREVVSLYRDNKAEFDALLAKAETLLKNLPVENNAPLDTIEEISDEDTDTEDYAENIEPSPIYTEFQTRCLSLLQNVTNGVDLSSSLDKDRFCLKYEETYGELSSDDKEEILKALLKVGEKRGEKIYPPPSQEKKEMIANLLNEIKQILSKYSCVYISSLFDKRRDVLSEHAIYSADELKEVLSSKLTADYEISYERIIRRGENANIGKDVLSYLAECGVPKTYDDIYRALWHIPPERVNEGVRNQRDIINTAPKTYMAVDIFPIYREGIDKIRVVLKEALQNSPNGRLSDEECRVIVEENFEDIARDTESYTTKAFHGALGYFLQNDPPFEGKYVTLSKGDIQSTKEIFIEFCENRENFFFDELEEFAKENNLSLSSYYNTIREKTLRISENEFCDVQSVAFNIGAIDAKLEQFCPEGYASLKSVKNFGLLPIVENISWNYFLLESYVNNISKKFITQRRLWT